jgi:hypothetical protein
MPSPQDNSPQTPPFGCHVPEVGFRYLTVPRSASIISKADLPYALCVFTFHFRAIDHFNSGSIAGSGSEWPKAIRYE